MAIRLLHKWIAIFLESLVVHRAIPETQEGSAAAGDGAEFCLVTLSVTSQAENRKIVHCVVRRIPIFVMNFQAARRPTVVAGHPWFPSARNLPPSVRQAAEFWAIGQSLSYTFAGTIAESPLGKLGYRLPATTGVDRRN